jgi:hypothetical protein
MLEPEACEEWRWFPVDQMPDNIFPQHAKIFKTIASGNIYIQNGFEPNIIHHRSNRSIASYMIPERKCCDTIQIW